LTDGARGSNVSSYLLDSVSGTAYTIQLKKLQLVNIDLLNIMDDNKLWFTHIDVLDVIYHQFFFTANILEWQSTTSQFFQPLAPQTVACVAVAIHSMLSQYATGKQDMVRISHDMNQVQFSHSTVIDFTAAEVTVLSNDTLVGCLIPPIIPLH